MNGTLYAVCVGMNSGQLEPLAFAITKEAIQELYDEIVKRGWFCTGGHSYRHTLDGFQFYIEEYNLVDGMITAEQTSKL